MAKKHKIVSDEEFPDYILSKINDIKDLEMLILKGHILIEYALNKYIQDCGSSNFDIYKEDFQFRAKIKLCKSLCLFDTDNGKKLEDLIISFNSLRNSIAHYLEYDDDNKKKLITLYRRMSDDLKDPLPDYLNELEIFKRFISNSCGFIIGVKMGVGKQKAFMNTLALEAFSKGQNEFIDRFNEFKA